jgi:hypothetical protein
MLLLNLSDAPFFHVDKFTSSPPIVERFTSLCKVQGNSFNFDCLLASPFASSAGAIQSFAAVNELNFLSPTEKAITRMDYENGYI